MFLYHLYLYDIIKTTVTILETKFYEKEDK